MGRFSLKNEEEALYTNRGRWNSKQHTTGRSKKNNDKARNHQGEENIRRGGASKNQENGKKFDGNCYNCGKKGHMAKACWSKKKSVESNVTASKSKDEWDAEALFIATTSKNIDYKKDWIVDSRCSNHMTGDKEKLQNLSKYKGSWVVVAANNSKLSIAYVGNTVVFPQHSDTEVPLQSIYHVLGMKKNLLLVAQLNIFWPFCSIWSTGCEGESKPGGYRRTGDEGTEVGISLCNVCRNRIRRQDKKE
ncbi:hypothetical protein V6Z11_D05G118100 [Gossypium hirsutum]